MSDSDSESLRSDALGKKPKTKKNNFLIPSFVFDAAIIACLAVFAYYLRFTATFNVFTRYFLCEDLNLRHPYYNDSNVTSNVLIDVNDTYFYCFTSLIPPLALLIGELMYMCLAPAPKKVITTCCDGFKIPLIIRRISRFTGVFWLGLLLLSILVDSIKIMVGQQRPYFLNIPSINENIDSTQNPYCIVNISAISENDSLLDSIREASLSFPSYHATLSAFAATYSIYYVQVIFEVHGSHFFRPIISSGLAGLAAIASFSQWMYYKNFYMDIIVGAVIGIFSGIYICYWTLGGFEEHIERDESAKITELQLQEAMPAVFKWMALPRLNVAQPRSPYPRSHYDNGGFSGEASKSPTLY
ncbi:hypothetical protein CHUAL_006252 [Chamberlinius hualienensis]